MDQMFSDVTYAQTFAAIRERREQEEQERLRLIYEWRGKAAAFDWLANQEIVSTPELLWTKRDHPELLKLEEQRGKSLLDAIRERRARQVGL